MRVNFLRHRAVNDRDDPNTGEKGGYTRPRCGLVRLEGFAKLANSFRENLHEGDVEHHSRGQPQGSRHKPGPRFALSYGKGASDGRRQAGEKHEAKCKREGG